MADYQPIVTGGAKPWTATTSAAVTGGRVLVESGSGTVAMAGADAADVVGVAAFDAGSGAKVTVWPLDGVVHELEASGAIASGAGVVTDANGQVKTATIATAAALGTLIGTATTTAAGSPTLKLRVQGRR
ncbi:capsid cement protein [Plantactinospora solaniradicis]|uniref:Capsid cement protein n=1 Tax=Plantactinospora solaniradicis TaxID=1723736 RepID=A0ABW1K7M9_9ACTN